MSIGTRSSAMPRCRSAIVSRPLRTRPPWASRVLRPRFRRWSRWRSRRRTTSPRRMQRTAGPPQRTSRTSRSASAPAGWRSPCDSPASRFPPALPGRVTSLRRKPTASATTSSVRRWASSAGPTKRARTSPMKDSTARAWWSWASSAWACSRETTCGPTDRRWPRSTTRSAVTRTKPPTGSSPATWCGSAEAITTTTPPSIR